MKMNLRFVALVLLAGCASYKPYLISVDGLGSTPPGMRKVAIVSGMADTGAEDLQFAEFSKYVVSALEGRGFISVNDPADADLAVFMQYGIGAPQQIVYSTPVIGQVAGKTARISGEVNATVKEKPQYGVVGTAVRTTTVFSRHLVLEAIDAEKLRQSGKAVPVWKTTVQSTGSSDDLRAVFPALVVAARPYFGTNTGKQVKVKIRPRSSELEGIKISSGVVTAPPVTLQTYETSDRNDTSPDESRKTEIPSGPPPQIDQVELGQAIARLREAIQSDPSNPWLYFSLGKLYALGRDEQRMEEAFANALRYGDRYLPDIEEQRRLFRDRK